MIAYPESVQYLYALGNEIKSSKLGLERISALMAAMDHPELAFRVVHVAGTNGKGSTCAMIERAVREAGHRTGLYTSPHLVEPTERIRIGGRDLSREEFTAAFEVVRSVASRLLDEGVIDMHPTYFETVTAMAFHAFRQAGVEWAVVEVGLGGRLDATNVVRPALAVITPVDFDHEAWLGSSLDAIAGEKAGILKHGAPAVIAPQHPEAMRRIEREAAAAGVRLAVPGASAVSGVRIDAFRSRFHAFGLNIDCPLAGEHQVMNALTAVTALRELGVAGGAIEKGIAAASWPGRLERVARNPDIILDGAHNPSGVRALAAYIRRFFGGRRVWLIYGTMRDKSVEEIGDMLSPVASEVILTAPDSPRALRPEALLPLFDHPNVRTAPNLGEALAIAREAAAGDVVFITGSLYLVGEARPLFVQ